MGYAIIVPKANYAAKRIAHVTPDSALHGTDGVYNVSGKYKTGGTLTYETSAVNNKLKVATASFLTDGGVNTFEDYKYYMPTIVGASIDLITGTITISKDHVTPTSGVSITVKSVTGNVVLALAGVDIPAYSESTDVYTANTLQLSTSTKTTSTLKGSANETVAVTTPTYVYTAVDGSTSSTGATTSISVSPNTGVTISGNTVKFTNSNTTGAAQSYTITSTVTKNGISLTSSIVVQRPSLSVKASLVGDNIVAVMSDGSTQEYIYETSNDLVATVDTTGKISKRGNGNVVFTVKVKNLTSLSDTISGYISINASSESNYYCEYGEISDNGYILYDYNSDEPYVLKCPEIQGSALNTGETIETIPEFGVKDTMTKASTFSSTMFDDFLEYQNSKDIVRPGETADFNILEAGTILRTDDTTNLYYNIGFEGAYVYPYFKLFDKKVAYTKYAILQVSAYSTVGKIYKYTFKSKSSYLVKDAVICLYKNTMSAVSDLYFLKNPLTYEVSKSDIDLGNSDSFTFTCTVATKNVPETYIFLIDMEKLDNFTINDMYYFNDQIVTNSVCTPTSEGKQIAPKIDFSKVINNKTNLKGEEYFSIWNKTLPMRYNVYKNEMLIPLYSKDIIYLLNGNLYQHVYEFERGKSDKYVLTYTGGKTFLNTNNTAKYNGGEPLNDGGVADVIKMFKFNNSTDPMKICIIVRDNAGLTNNPNIRYKITYFNKDKAHDETKVSPTWQEITKLPYVNGYSIGFRTFLNNTNFDSLAIGIVTNSEISDTIKGRIYITGGTPLDESEITMS